MSEERLKEIYDELVSIRMLLGYLVDHAVKESTPEVIQKEVNIPRVKPKVRRKTKKAKE